MLGGGTERGRGAQLERVVVSSFQLLSWNKDGKNGEKGDRAKGAQNTFVD
jgi:hypothetical protein